MPAIPLCLLLTLLCTTVNAQRYFVHQFGVNEGLASEQVRDVMTARDGFLWVATDAGLFRFDGRDFVPINRHLESRYIRDLERINDSLLVFSSDAGVYALHEEDNELGGRTVQIIPGEVAASDSVLLYPNQLFFDQRERLWISQPDHRLSRWKNDSLQHYSFQTGTARGASADAFHFAQASDSTLWVSTPNGQLYRYDETADEFIHAPLRNRLSTIQSMYCQNDTLWLGGDGLVRGLIADGRFRQEIGYNSGGSIITSFLSIKTSGSLLVGTRESGLFRLQFSGSDLSFQQIFGSNDPHRIERLPFNQIHALYRDQLNNLWLSTGQGLGLLQSRFFQTIFGLTNNNTLAIHPDQYHEVLLSYGEAYTIKKDEVGFSSTPIPLEEDFITSLADGENQVWLGSIDGRLLNVHQEQKQTALDLSERGGGLFFIEHDSNGNIWICQAPNETPIVGVGKFGADGVFREYAKEEGLDNRILVVRESPRGRIYAAGIGPETYLYRYQMEEDVFTNLSLPLPFPPSQGFEVHDIAIDERGIVWLATTDGLLRYDLERIQRVQLGDLTTSEIRSVTAMTDGQLWCASATEGLIAYQDRDQSFILFDEACGLPSIIATYRCLTASAAGHLWIGTAEGVVYSRDALPTALLTQPPIWLSLQLDQEPQTTKKALSIGIKNTLSLRWASPMFPGGLINYRYRLKSKEDSLWIDLETENQLQLRQLPFGDYTLEISAKMEGGYTWSEPLSLSLYVRPPWHTRWWARTLFLLAGLAALYVLFQMNIGRLLRRIRLLETALGKKDAELKEKERQLATLTPTDLARQRQQASKEARENEWLQPARLHQILAEIPPHATWSKVLPILAQHVSEADGPDAFEIGWNEGQEICIRHFDKSKGVFSWLTAEFSEKTSLPVWALTHKQSVQLHQASIEINEYIENDEELDFESVLCVPFEVSGRQVLVFSLYSKKTHQFNEIALERLEVLLQYLSVAIDDQLRYKQ